MDSQRRKILKAGGSVGVLGALVAAGMVSPELALAARNRALFEAGSIEAAFAALGAEPPAESAQIRILAPDVAENGAVVPIGVTSALPATEQIVILIEKNVNRVAASFALPPGTLPEVHTRVKMAESSRVHAVVRAGERLYRASREVRVTVGGCAA